MYASLKKTIHYRKLFLCLILLIAWCWVMPAPAQADTQAVGEIASLTGTLDLTREGKSRQAGIGDAVHLLDRLQTGPDSRAEIVFVDDSRVRMAPGTILEVTEYLYQPDQKKRQSLLSLWSGKARFLVSELVDYVQKGFEVQTPNGTAGVRGTDFIVEVRKKD
jgi:hypothetical protein